MEWHLPAIGSGGGLEFLFAALQNSREIASPIIQASAGLCVGFAMTWVLLWLPDGGELMIDDFVGWMSF